jgi:hypothetical protein
LPPGDAAALSIRLAGLSRNGIGPLPEKFDVIVCIDMARLMRQRRSMRCGDMMERCMFLTLAMTMSAIAAQPPKPTVVPAQKASATIFGVGNASCQAAFTSERRTEAQIWVLGFWSGMNFGLAQAVGRPGDAENLIGKVEAICEANPSQVLMAATLEARQADR